MKIIKDYITKNDRYKQNMHMKVKGLMIHDVGCTQPKASAFISQWNKPNVTVAVHAIIEKGGIVHQCLPWNIKGWHSGAGSKSVSANNMYIGVEMTIPNSIVYTGPCTFKITDKADAKAHVLDTYNTAVELFAKLCEENNLDPLGKNDLGYPIILNHVEGHELGIASNHGDTASIWSKFGLTMTKFRKDIASKMKEPKKAIVNNKDYNCAAKVVCSDTLNVRDKRADSEGNLGNIVDTLENGTEVTLGYVYNSWGSIYYIKEGKINHGFVNVKYLKLV